MILFVLTICTLITEMPSLRWDFAVGLEHQVLLAERHLVPPKAVHVSFIPNGHSVAAVSAQQVVLRRKSRGEAQLSACPRPLRVVSSLQKCPVAWAWHCVNLPLGLKQASATPSVAALGSEVQRSVWWGQAWGVGMVFSAAWSKRESGHGLCSAQHAWEDRNLHVGVLLSAQCLQRVRNPRSLHEIYLMMVIILCPSLDTSQTQVPYFNW